MAVDNAQPSDSVHAVRPHCCSEYPTNTMTKANDIQVAGDHYKAKAIQPWDYIVSNELGYLEGNVVKYVSRWKDKGGIDDLRKARHYLDKLIEVNTPT